MDKNFDENNASENNSITRVNLDTAPLAINEQATVTKWLTPLGRRLVNLENAIRVQENRTLSVQAFTVAACSYCVPALVFGIQKLIDLIARMHPFDPQFAWQIVYGTAFYTYGFLGLSGGIVCFLTYKLLIRTKIPAPFTLIIALLCSFFLPVLFEILREYQTTIAFSKLGGAPWVVPYQFFVYMPQVWGLGGLSGGISAMASLLLIHPSESMKLLLGKKETPLLERR